MATKDDLQKPATVPYNDERNRSRRHGKYQYARRKRKELKDQERRNEIIEHVSKLAGERLRRMHKLVFNTSATGSSIGTRPTRPSELWNDRANKTEPAPEFIERVYGPGPDGKGMNVLDGNFTRADLRRLDRAAEKALRGWEYRNHHLRLDELNLPTIAERNSLLLEKGPENEADPLKRQALKKIESDRAYLAKK